MPLLYRTRGQSSPQGKPRIFFSCHPADFPAYFREITDEILQLSNCAIYYYEGEPPRDREHYENLSQMQMVVVPITARLLSVPCPTVTADLPYALAYHIPVLPLMQEPGLDSLFSEKFGSLQYLDKTSRDNTAISFRKKLEDYLASVLVGDELALRIRQEFSAYIFLSYRKKDRKYAQELMGLIHGHACCRDVAIWYDEFLVPGEDWSDSIRQALKKSKVFALAVTPNLVNENNYVMSTEYPMALQAEKPVIAAELVPTDPELLHRFYRPYPGSIDPRDPEALFQSLSGHLDFTGSEKMNTPLHQFLIGLAYLSGLDVEVDHSRAVTMITAAARAGLPGAMEKLAAMYRNGEGVASDRDKEVYWLKKLVNHARRRLLTGPSPANALGLATCWKDLGNVLLELGRLKAAETAFRRSLRILNLLEKHASFYDYNLLCKERSDCYTQLAAVYRAEGKSKTAGDFIEKAYYAAPWSLPPSAPVEMVLAKPAAGVRLAEHWLHDLHYLDLAQENYREAMELLEQLEQEGQSSPEIRRILVQGYMGLGEICTDSRQPEKAREWFEKALAMQSQLTAELDTPQARLSLAVVHRSIGTALLAEGNREGALTMYLGAWDILWELAEGLNFGSALHELTVVCDLLADISTPEDAESWIAMGLSWSCALYEETPTGFTRRDLASMLLKNGALHLRQGKLNRAEELLLKALPLGQTLAEQTGELSDKLLLLDIQLKIAGLIAAKGDLRKAMQQCRRILAAIEKLEKKTYTNATNRIELLANLQLGDIYLRLGFDDRLENLLDANMCLDDAAINCAFTPLTNEVLEAMENLIRSYCALAEQFLTANADTDLPLDMDACLCYEEAYRLELRLYAKTRSPEYLPRLRELCLTLSRVYTQSAEVYDDEDDLKIAAFWQEKARAVDTLPETENIDLDEDFP